MDGAYPLRPAAGICCRSFCLSLIHICSVNTIVNKDGKLYGYVTDGMGYTGELRRGGVEVAGKVITLLGAGGAASAIAIEAALEGAKEIRVFNKRDGFWERALANLKTIGDAAPACKITLSDLDDAEACLLYTSRSRPRGRRDKLRPRRRERLRRRV